MKVVICLKQRIADKITLLAAKIPQQKCAASEVTSSGDEYITLFLHDARKSLVSNGVILLSV